MFKYLVGYLLLVSCITIYMSPRAYYSGNTSDWQPYTGSRNGAYVIVDFKFLNLTKIPQVSTSLVCNSHCWATTGANSIYELSNYYFKVYIRFP